MKNQIKLTVFTLLISITLKAQTLKFDSESSSYLLSEVVAVDGKTEEQIFNAVKEWASSDVSNFNRRNAEKMDILVAKKNTEVIDAGYKIDNPLKLADKEGGKLIIAVSSKYNGTQIGTIRTMYVNYDLKVIVKDGKFKFEAANFSYNHINNATGKLMPLSGFKDGGDCGSKGTFETLKNCDVAEKAFNKMIEWYNEDITLIKDSLTKKIKSSKNEKDF